MQAPTNFDARMIARNAEIVQQAMQTGIEIAMRMTEFSAANIEFIREDSQLSTRGRA